MRGQRAHRLGDEGRNGSVLPRVAPWVFRERRLSPVHREQHRLGYGAQAPKSGVRGWGLKRPLVKGWEQPRRASRKRQRGFSVAGGSQALNLDRCKYTEKAGRRCKQTLSST